MVRVNDTSITGASIIRSLISDSLQQSRDFQPPWFGLVLGCELFFNSAE